VNGILIPGGAQDLRSGQASLQTAGQPGSVRRAGQADRLHCMRFACSSVQPTVLRVQPAHTTCLSFPVPQPFFDTVQQLVDLTIEANDKGNYFPVSDLLCV